MNFDPPQSMLSLRRTLWENFETAAGGEEEKKAARALLLQLRVVDLKDLCRTRGYKVGGTKEQLVSRLPFKKGLKTAKKLVAEAEENRKLAAKNLAAVTAVPSSI